MDTGTRHADGIERMEGGHEEPQIFGIAQGKWLVLHTETGTGTGGPHGELDGFTFRKNWIERLMGQPAAWKRLRLEN